VLVLISVLKWSAQLQSHSVAELLYGNKFAE